MQLQFFRMHKPRTGAPVDLRFRSRGSGIELSFGKFIDGNVDACLFLHAKSKLPLKDAPNAKNVTRLTGILYILTIYYPEALQN